MSFRLWTIFYVFALFASAMATFGAFGIVVAVLVLCIWALIFFRAMTLVEVLVVLSILGMLVALLMPAVNASHESSRRAMCMNNMKNLTAALLDYASKNGSLPPSYTSDSNGSKLHSWRTLTLPHMERSDLYEKLDLAKPWNDSANRPVSSGQVDYVECPDDSQSFGTSNTSYFAITGEQTAWPAGRGRRTSEITDPKSCTILLIEAHEKGIPWAQPDDLSFDEAVTLLTSEADGVHSARRRGFFYKSWPDMSNAINVAMANGDVRLLNLPLPKDLAVALLTVDGGEADVESQLAYYSGPQLDYAKIYACCVFVLLSLAPAIPLLLRGRKPAGA
jgi:prepilin-type N-terminal cleavage/methylation domain-containing protein